MICFYHSADLDGKCSAAIVKMAHPECVLYRINYGQPFPWQLVKEHANVWMVDYGLQPFSDMEKLNEMCHLVWIDHHKTAIADMEKSSQEFEGIQEEGSGACQWVWRYLHPKIHTPAAIQLLAQYDVWNHDNPYTLPFQYGMRLEDLDPNDIDSWNKVCDNKSGYANEITEKGRIVQEYIKNHSKALCCASAHDIEFEGYKCICINVPLINSLTFDSIENVDEYDIRVSFYWKKYQWTVSLYSDKVDCSVIAKKYGGGGHPGASGFQCDELPWRENNAVS